MNRGNMERTIYNYALIKSLYDHGCDFLDCFLPIMLSSMPATDFISIKGIATNIKTKYGIEIPAHVLESLIKKSARKMLIEQKASGSMFSLSEKGKILTADFRDEQDVEAHINSFLADLGDYFKNSKVVITRDELYSCLLTFLSNNTRYLKEFINPMLSEEKVVKAKLKTHEKLIVDYIKLARKEKPLQLKTFKEMVFGSIISTILYSKTPTDAYEIIKMKFKKCVVYLDTNFIFSLLDLHPTEFNEPAKELFGLLKKVGFKIKVFSFTINEISSLISGYESEQHKYTQHLRVNTIYSHLKRKGWTITQAKEFVINIDRILMDMNIEVEWIANSNLKTIKLKRPDLRAIIARYKPDQNDLSRNHDLLAIETIEDIRKVPVRRIEDSKAFFLSSDVRLGKFDFLELGHKENQTVCEVILDRLLTNILWLKDPSSDLPFKTIIATNASDLFINRRVWDRFYDILQNLKAGSKISDEQVAMLIYHHNIEDTLRYFDNEDIYKITPEFIFEQAEEAARTLDENKKIEIQQKEKEFIRLLGQKVSSARDEKDKQWLQRIGEIKQEIRNDSKAKANATINAIKCAIAAAFSILMLFLLYKYGWDLITKISTLAGIVLLIPIFNAFDFGNIWDRLQDRLTNARYARYLKKIKITE